MEITRLLRHDRPDEEGRVPIHLRICWEGKKVRLSSSERVHPKEWDAKNQQLKGKVFLATHINNRLDKYEQGLKTFAYQQENSGVVVTPDMIRAEVARIRQKELGQTSKHVLEPTNVPKRQTLSEFLEDYQTLRPGGVSPSTATHIQAIRAHLDAFLPGMDFPHLTVNTLNQLKNYFSEEIGLADNSVSAYFGSFRGALKYALSKSLPVPADYTLVSGTPAKVIRPALSWEHLAKIRAQEWNGTLQPVVWLFLMACYTGLRHSDLSQIRRSGVRMVDGYPCLMAIQQKSGTHVAIPLVEEAVHLLDQHPEGHNPFGLHHYNNQLKLIARKAGLTELVTVSSRYHGQLIHSAVPLCDTLASHTARRTFASMMIEGGMNTKVLQQLMGHSTISSTEKYVTLPSKVIVGQTLDAWRKVAGETPLVTPLWKKIA